MKKTFLHISDTLQFIKEFFAQIAYIGFIISAIIILFKTLPHNQAIVYTISLVLHLTTIACLGYISFWEKTKKSIFCLFSILNACIIVATIITTGSLIAIPLYLVLGFIGISYIQIMECLICFLVSLRPSLDAFFVKHPIFWYMFYLIIPISAIIIPLMFLSLNIFFKIGIIFIYIISFPFIAMAADNGFDIQEIIDSCVDEIRDFKLQIKTRDN